MSSWSRTLQSNAGTLRTLSGQLREEPFGKVHRRLDEVWRGPAADELLAGARSQDRSLANLGNELERIARNLDGEAAAIEAWEAIEAAAATAASEVTVPEPGLSPTPPAAYSGIF